MVVLDRDLPVVHGDDVCRQLVESGSATRVLMLTAAAEVTDRVAGLGLGADDYLTKPFAFAELAARVLALGRRSRPAAPPVLRRAGITLDPARHEVFRDGRYVPLSSKEFAVLAELLRADGAAVSAEQLLEKAWDEHADPFTGAVRLTILKLRRKLGEPGRWRPSPASGTGSREAADAAGPADPDLRRAVPGGRRPAARRHLRAVQRTTSGSSTG